jgi:hypothetical protein
MGPGTKQVLMTLNTFATHVGRDFGEAAGGGESDSTKADKKEKNGYPIPENLEEKVFDWVLKEKTENKKFCNPPTEDDDEKDGFYKKHGLRCQHACEKILGKKRGELDLSREWIKIKVEEFLTCEFEYYKDKHGNEYKNEVEIPCWFCDKVETPGYPQYWCDHERFQKDGSVKACTRVCCTKCSDQGPDFDPAKDDFFCKVHNTDEYKKKHLEVQEEKTMVDFVETVEEHVYKPKKKVKTLNAFKNVGGEKNVSYGKVLALLGITENRVPTDAEYKRACICTENDDGFPTFTLRDEPLPEEKIEIKLSFPKDKAGHFWYKDYSGKTYDKVDFLDLFKTVRKEMIEDLDNFPIIKKKKKTAKNELEENKTREKLAERVDLLSDLMKCGHACFSKQEWKDYNQELNKYWERLDLHLLPGEKASSPPHHFHPTCFHSLSHSFSLLPRFRVRVDLFFFPVLRDCSMCRWGLLHCIA